jgi:outer membrane protein OmpA-like peptidoglycan-associated protein
MTNSPTTRTPESTRPVVAAPTRFNWGRALFTLIFRLLLLGIGGTLAAAVGIAIAQLYPAQTQEPPLAEKLLQSSDSFLDNLKQLPQTWRGQTPEATPAESQSAPAPQVTASSSPISDAERQQLQAELTQLQAELQTLTTTSTEPLADRVQELQKRIQAIQERLSNLATAPSSQTFVAPATSSTVNGEKQLMVTLPSDALFSGKETTLRPGTETILNSILTDLQRYPQAAIQVGAHTDNQGSAEADRHRSLEQAKAVQQYLSTQMDETIHWVTVGYGHNRPLVPEDSPENRQRNRRIEIVINPK